MVQQSIAQSLILNTQLELVFPVCVIQACHHVGGHIAALISQSLHSGRQLATSCGNVPKLLPLTAEAAETADLPSSSKSSHGRQQGIEPACRHVPMVLNYAPSPHKHATNIPGAWWWPPPRVALPPAVTVRLTDSTDSARFADQAGSVARATSTKITKITAI